MIKIKNKELVQLTTPIMTKIIEKEFPIKDSFKLQLILTEAQTYFKTYQAAMAKLRTKYNIRTGEDNQIEYDNDEDLNTFIKEANELLDIEVELSQSKLDIGDNWPNLSVQEVSVLKPLLNDIEE